MKVLPEKSWHVTLLDAQDGSGDFIIVLPDVLKELMGVGIGDELSVEVLNNQAKFTKHDHWSINISLLN